MIRILIKNVLMLTLIVTVFIGCATTIGKDFDINKTKDIKVGRTTAFEVLNMFGSPYRKNLKDSDETWSYRFYQKSPVTNETICIKELDLTIDKYGVVTHFSYNSRLPESN